MRRNDPPARRGSAPDAPHGRPLPPRQPWALAGCQSRARPPAALPDGFEAETAHAYLNLGKGAGLTVSASSGH